MPLHSRLPLHTALVLPRVPRVPAPAPQLTLLVPLIEARRQLRALTDARPLAAALIADATGEAVTDEDVDVLIVPPGVVVLPAGPTPTEVCHPQDRRWYPGATIGWANQLGRSWRPVVRYVVGTVQWERIVAAGWWRPLRADSGPADPPPADPVRVPAPRSRQSRSPGRGVAQPSRSGSSRVRR
jgi:hypothetical protein